MPSAADQLADLYNTHSIDLTKFEYGERRRVLALLQDLEEDLVSKLKDLDPASIPEVTHQQRRLAQLLGQARATIGTTYSDTSKLMGEDMKDLANVESLFAANSIDQVTGMNVMDATLTPEQLRSISSDILIQGAPSRDWWGTQSGKTQKNFEREIRLGMLQGEGIDDMVRRIRGSSTGKRRAYENPITGRKWTAHIFKGGIMDVSRRDAEALVRTSVAAVSAEARMQTFIENQDVVKGVQQLSMLDGRTTPICRAYSNKAWTFQGMDKKKKGGSYKKNIAALESKLRTGFRRKTTPGRIARMAGYYAVTSPFTFPIEALQLHIREPEMMGDLLQFTKDTFAPFLPETMTSVAALKIFSPKEIAAKHTRLLALARDTGATAPEAALALRRAKDLERNHPDVFPKTAAALPEPATPKPKVKVKVKVPPRPVTAPPGTGWAPIVTTEQAAEWLKGTYFEDMVATLYDSKNFRSILEGKVELSKLRSKSWSDLMYGLGGLALDLAPVGVTAGGWFKIAVRVENPLLIDVTGEDTIFLGSGREVYPGIAEFEDKVTEILNEMTQTAYSEIDALEEQAKVVANEIGALDPDEDVDEYDRLDELGDTIEDQIGELKDRVGIYQTTHATALAVQQMGYDGVVIKGIDPKFGSTEQVIVWERDQFSVLESGHTIIYDEGIKPYARFGSTEAMFEWYKEHDVFLRPDIFEEATNIALMDVELTELARLIEEFPEIRFRVGVTNNPDWRWGEYAIDARAINFHAGQFSQETEVMMRARRESSASLFHPRFMVPPATATHEFGHAMYYQISPEAREPLLAFLNLMAEELTRYDVSEYAMQDISELFAESFVAIVSTPRDHWTPWMHKFHDVLGGIVEQEWPDSSLDSILDLQASLGLVSEAETLYGEGLAHKIVPSPNVNGVFLNGLSLAAYFTEMPPYYYEYSLYGVQTIVNIEELLVAVDPQTLSIMQYGEGRRQELLSEVLLDLHLGDTPDILGEYGYIKDNLIVTYKGNRVQQLAWDGDPSETGINVGTRSSVDPSAEWTWTHIDPADEDFVDEVFDIQEDMELLEKRLEDSNAALLASMSMRRLRDPVRGAIMLTSDQVEELLEVRVGMFSDVIQDGMVTDSTAGIAELIGKEIEIPEFIRPTMVYDEETGYDPSGRGATVWLDVVLPPGTPALYVSPIRKNLREMRVKNNFSPDERLMVPGLKLRVVDWSELVDQETGEVGYSIQVEVVREGVEDEIKYLPEEFIPEYLPPETVTLVAVDHYLPAMTYNQVVAIHDQLFPETPIAQMIYDGVEELTDVDEVRDLVYAHIKTLTDEQIAATKVRVPRPVPMDLQVILPDLPEPKEFWQMTTDEFLGREYTGRIREGAYEGYETSKGLRDFITPEKYTEVVQTVAIKEGVEVQIKKSTEPLRYTAHDKDGEILRDEQGQAVMMTDEEAIAQGLPVESVNLGAFIDDRPVGFASDEWGTTGVWVTKDVQEQGVGLALLKKFRELNPALAAKPLGQMTPAGSFLAKALHRDAVKQAIEEGKAVPAAVLADYPGLTIPLKEEAAVAEFETRIEVQEKNFGKEELHQITLDPTWGINAKLRLIGKTEGDIESRLSGKDLEKVQYFTEVLEYIPPLDRSVLVYRGVSDLPTMLNIESLDDLSMVVGTGFTEYGYSSTTPTFEQALPYVFPEGLEEAKIVSPGAAFLEIELPKGTKGLYLDALKDKGQVEFRLDHGKTFEVVGVVGHHVHEATGTRVPIVRVRLVDTIGEIVGEAAEEIPHPVEVTVYVQNQDYSGALPQDRETNWYSLPTEWHEVSTFEEARAVIEKEIEANKHIPSWRGITFEDHAKLRMSSGPGSGPGQSIGAGRALYLDEKARGVAKEIVGSEYTGLTLRQTLKQTKAWALEVFEDPRYLTDEFQEAYALYQTEAGIYYNMLLRSERTLNQIDQIYGGVGSSAPAPLVEEIKKIEAHFIPLLQETKTQAPVTLYRGVLLDEIAETGYRGIIAPEPFLEMRTVEDLKALVGTRFEDKSVVSTSLDPTTAQAYGAVYGSKYSEGDTYWSLPIMFEIDVPEGTTGIYLSHPDTWTEASNQALRSAGQGNMRARERTKELVLGSNLLFQVDGVELRSLKGLSYVHVNLSVVSRIGEIKAEAGEVDLSNVRYHLYVNKKGPDDIQWTRDEALTETFSSFKEASDRLASYKMVDDIITVEIYAETQIETGPFFAMGHRWSVDKKITWEIGSEEDLARAITARLEEQAKPTIPPPKFDLLRAPSVDFVSLVDNDGTVLGGPWDTVDLDEGYGIIQEEIRDLGRTDLTFEANTIATLTVGGRKVSVETLRAEIEGSAFFEIDFGSEMPDWSISDKRLFENEFREEIVSTLPQEVVDEVRKYSEAPAGREIDYDVLLGALQPLEEPLMVARGVPASKFIESLGEEFQSLVDKRGDMGMTTGDVESILPQLLQLRFSEDRVVSYSLDPETALIFTEDLAPALGRGGRQESGIVLRVTLPKGTKIVYTDAVRGMDWMLEHSDVGPEREILLSPDHLFEVTGIARQLNPFQEISLNRFPDYIVDLKMVERVGKVLAEHEGPKASKVVSAVVEYRNPETGVTEYFDGITHADAFIELMAKYPNVDLDAIPEERIAFGGLFRLTDGTIVTADQLKPIIGVERLTAEALAREGRFEIEAAERGALGELVEGRVAAIVRYTPTGEVFEALTHLEARDLLAAKYPDFHPLDVETDLVRLEDGSIVQAVPVRRVAAIARHVPTGEIFEAETHTMALTLARQTFLDRYNEKDEFLDWTKVVEEEFQVTEVRLANGDIVFSESLETNQLYLRPITPKVPEVVTQIASMYKATPTRVTVELVDDPKAKPKQCFDNAYNHLKKVGGDEDKYVLGFMTVHGVPVEHSWVKIGGKYLDCTPVSDDLVVEYFSVVELTMEEVKAAGWKKNQQVDLAMWYRNVKAKEGPKARLAKKKGLPDPRTRPEAIVLQEELEDTLFTDAWKDEVENDWQLMEAVDTWVKDPDELTDDDAQLIFSAAVKLKRALVVYRGTRAGHMLEALGIPEDSMTLEDLTQIVGLVYPFEQRMTACSLNPSTTVLFERVFDPLPIIIEYRLPSGTHIFSTDATGKGFEMEILVGKMGYDARVLGVDWIKTEHEGHIHRARRVVVKLYPKGELITGAGTVVGDLVPFRPPRSEYQLSNLFNPVIDDIRREAMTAFQEIYLGYSETIRRQLSVIDRNLAAINNWILGKGPAPTEIDWEMAERTIKRLAQDAPKAFASFLVVEQDAFMASVKTEEFKLGDLLTSETFVSSGLDLEKIYFDAAYMDKELGGTPLIIRINTPEKGQVTVTPNGTQYMFNRGTQFKVVATGELELSTGTYRTVVLEPVEGSALPPPSPSQGSPDSAVSPSALPQEGPPSSIVPISGESPIWKALVEDPQGQIEAAEKYFQELGESLDWWGDRADGFELEIIRKYQSHIGMALVKELRTKGSIDLRGSYEFRITGEELLFLMDHLDDLMIDSRMSVPAVVYRIMPYQHFKKFFNLPEQPFYIDPRILVGTVFGDSGYISTSFDLRWVKDWVDAPEPPQDILQAILRGEMPEAEPYLTYWRGIIFEIRVPPGARALYVSHSKYQVEYMFPDTWDEEGLQWIPPGVRVDARELLLDRRSSFRIVETREDNGYTYIVLELVQQRGM